MATHVSPGAQDPGGAGAKCTTPLSGESFSWSPAVTVTLPSLTRQVLLRPMMPAASADGSGAGGSVIGLRQTGPGSLHRVWLAQFAVLMPFWGSQFEHVSSSCIATQALSQVISMNVSGSGVAVVHV